MGLARLLTPQVWETATGSAPGRGHDARPAHSSRPRTTARPSTRATCSTTTTMGGGAGSGTSGNTTDGSLSSRKAAPDAKPPSTGPAARPRRSDEATHPPQSTGRNGQRASLEARHPAAVLTAGDADGNAASEREAAPSLLGRTDLRLHR